MPLREQVYGCISVVCVSIFRTSVCPTSFAGGQGGGGGYGGKKGGDGGTGERAKVDPEPLVALGFVDIRADGKWSNFFCG
jgi:hypothetical protein